MQTNQHFILFASFCLAFLQRVKHHLPCNKSMPVRQPAGAFCAACRGSQEWSFTSNMRLAQRSSVITGHHRSSLDSFGMASRWSGSAVVCQINSSTGWWCHYTYYTCYLPTWEDVEIERTHMFMGDPPPTTLEYQLEKGPSMSLLAARSTVHVVHAPTHCGASASGK